MYLSRPNETLDKHIDSVLRQFKNLDKSKNIDSIINNIINKLCKENKDLIGQENDVKTLVLEMTKLHDEGKKNPYFQAYLGNLEYASYKFTQLNKHHTEIGAIYYCITMYNNYVSTVKRPVQEALKDIILSLAYNIYRHHSSLEDLDKSVFIEKLIYYYENNKEQFININLTNIEYLYRFKNRNKIVYKNPYTYYLLCKLAYSILITCDFTAVYGFNNKGDLEVNTVDVYIKNEINKKFSNSEVIKAIRQFENNTNFPLSELNKYRTEMFLESEKQLIKSKDNNIFYLEAPTGCGKSLTSLNLAYNLLDNTINKIYYIAPFNNIAEQTHKVIKDSFYNNVVTVNSREDIFISNNEENDFINYDKDFLNSQMINYPVSLISHVRLFDILFSANRFKNLMLSNLCNSVIIIDEIQSYKNQLWINIINTLKEFAEMLNLKVIIMSATLPKMNELLEDKTYQIPDLICSRDYYYNYFKQRVEFDFTLLKKVKNDIKEVFDKIDEVIKNTNKHRILIECLTTAGADNFYNEMKKYESEGFLVFKMTGITNSTNREFIIRKVQNKFNKVYENDKIILVGTQCIEAGVDIDMQIGFKDISILDADEQFSGRIERNFNDTGTVYFFDIDNGDFIYKGDFRTEKNLKDDDWKEIFRDKDFSEFYKRNYKWLLEKKIDEYKEYKANLGELKYAITQENMKLIDTKNYSFLFICKYEGKRGADELFKEYLETQKSDLKYTEKQVKSTCIRKELNNYIYNINTYKFKNNILLEKVGNLYIVQEGTSYFDNLNEGELTKSSTLELVKFVSEVGLFL
ncbi:CRISPR-associated helicase Cas3' [Clostridium sp. CF011]|uniref:CRISPR-associated helicase Cas3' n=1 Tax=Clostridium sp. CF011 TaxID=2843318 RepID=UPI001C0B6186|nr:CRISPR-associated helicase Cas3' [Clostridium sp. CF011]MBU3092738.1 CRISPR-associated helicase Cas3' [Clostridium sp. CF011]WAG71159.1 CRISPR-associated helicase Cas3' [Clostridium sp. CF011]